MSESTFGNIFKVTTWGESHGPAIGCVIDKVPAGISLCEDDFDFYMEQRKPKEFGTPRKEADKDKILSGVFEGKTTGTPISLLIENNNTKSTDYNNIKDLYRPGHADFSYDTKYGFRDYRGGGRSSGRETAVRVAAGVVARKILDTLNITFISEYTVPENVPENDSLGGIIKTIIHNVPAGLGEPVFDKLDARLSQAIMSIGAVKGVIFGDGLEVTDKKGSEFNDEFTLIDGKITTQTNHCGGILGGISTGNDIIITSYIKPVPSISLPQKTVSKEKEETTIETEGRHDKYLPPRIAPVIEAMASITLADALLINMTTRIENIKKIYE